MSRDAPSAPAPGLAREPDAAGTAGTAGTASTVCARYHVLHETHYHYDSAVILSQQYLHLTPRAFAHQDVDAHQLRIEPGVNERSDGVDYFGNATRHVALTVPHEHLLVHAESTVTLRTRPSAAQLAQVAPLLSWERVRDLVRAGAGADPATLDACRYLYASPKVALFADLAAYARASYRPGRAHLDAALDLAMRIFSDFTFDPKATDISTPLEQVLRGRRGVCQDFAQLMIGCLRSLGLPARYMSGYILTHPLPGHPRLVGADASHAWVAVYCPLRGWIDIDPTNGCLVQHEHITLGWGRDFSDVTPLRGIVLGGGRQRLEVRVTVTPLAL